MLDSFYKKSSIDLNKRDSVYLAKPRTQAIYIIIKKLHYRIKAAD